MRTASFFLEPEPHNKKFGLFIPNVIFPMGCVVIDGLLWIYYGRCDTAIGLATVGSEEPLDHIFYTSRT